MKSSGSERCFIDQGCSPSCGHDTTRHGKFGNHDVCLEPSRSRCVLERFTVACMRGVECPEAVRKDNLGGSKAVRYAIEDVAAAAVARGSLDTEPIELAL